MIGTDTLPLLCMGLIFTLVRPSEKSEIAMWREFEMARPPILGALLDAVRAHGRVHLDRPTFAPALPESRA